MDSVNFSRTFKQKIEKITEIPTLPGIGRQLLELQTDDNAGIQQLIKIIEIDPILTTRILKHANSVYYKAAREITALLDAINLIGFRTALNLSLSMVFSKSFTVDNEGPIGARAFWSHSIYSAHLMQLLANKIPLNDKPDADVAYIAGLLHNFGVILLGHTFPLDFNALNKTLSKNPSETLLQTERRLLGIHHYELGVWLMRKWHMPKEITYSVFAHHNEDYKGECWMYANLALICDRALRKIKMGDGDNDELPQRALSNLKLSHDEVKATLATLEKEKNKLDTIIESVLEAN